MGIVWGANRDTHKLSWLMLVMEKQTLLRYCHHVETAEELAAMPDDALDLKMAPFGIEKISQVMAVYTRHLQMKEPL